MDWLGTVLPFLGQFNEQETSKQLTREERQWQEDMYNKYNSPSALVRQYKEAGINPALMFGGQTPAMETSTAPAAVAPSPTGSLTDMLGQLLNLSLLEENRENISADTRNKNANAAGKEIENRVQEKFAELTASASYNEILARIGNLKANTRLTNYQREVIGPLEEALKKAQESNLSSEAVYQEWINGFIDRHGSDPNAPYILQFISSLMDRDQYDPRHKSNRPPEVHGGSR